MKISVEHRDRDFNLSLSSKEGAEPFLTIRGCRIVDGAKGQFVSYPARKTDDGKWWNHVKASDAFNSAVIAEAAKSAPKKQRAIVEDDGLPPF